MASNIPQKSAKAAQVVATTAMPFLYQTKTLLNNTTPLRRAALQQLLRSRPTRHCLHSSARRRQNDAHDRRPLYEGGVAPATEHPETPAPPNSPAMSASSEYEHRTPAYHNEFMRTDSARQRRAAHARAPIRKVGVKLPRDSEPQDGSDIQRFTISKLPVSGGEGKYRRLEKKASKSSFDDPEDVPWESSGAAVVKKRTPAVVDDSFGDFGADEMGYNPFDGEAMFAEDEGEPDFSIPAASAPGESTITLEERHTFEAIFEDIYKRTQNGTLNSSGKAQARELQAKKIDPSAAKRKLASILNDGEAAEEQAHGSMADLKSYPQALRAVAAQALGLTGKKAPKKETKKVITAQDEQRTKERDRVEKLLVGATSDIALWAVMEKEVFSLIPRLGLGVEVEKAGASVPTLKDRRTKAGKRAVAEAEKAFMEARAAAEARGETEIVPLEKEKKLDMAIYGPLYPYYLLRSLQLLNSSFSKSSPLTLNVLPRIKSLGLASHILGASTPFYNELMRIYYYTYSDFKGVARLLLEMLNSGQEMDGDTYAVVMDIVKMQSRLGKAAGGGAEGKGQISEGLRRLYEMPQFFGKQSGATGRNGYGRQGRVFLGWERAIRRDLEGKEDRANLALPY